MLEILKKKARTSHIIRAVVSLIAAAAILAWTKFAIFNVITGPVELDIEKDPAAYSGKYVTIAADAVLTDYVEHSTTTTRRYGGSSTTVNGNSYIAFQAVYDYENDVSVWYFYSIYMDKSDQNMMYARIDDTWEYLEDETGAVAPPDALKVTGTWTPMESDVQRYYLETLADMGVEESEYDKFYFYNLDTGKIGGQSTLFFWALMAAALLLIVYAVYHVIGIFGNRYASAIHKYLQENSTTSIADIETDFNKAHVIGKDTWIGKRWTVYIRGTKAAIVTNKNLIWGYYYKRTGRNSVSEMRLYTTDGKIAHVSMSEVNATEALGYLGAEQPQMIVGYSADLEKTWQKNFSEFMDLKYRPAMQTAEAENTEETKSTEETAEETAEESRNENFKSDNQN